MQKLLNIMWTFERIINPGAAFGGTSFLNRNPTQSLWFHTVQWTPPCGYCVTVTTITSVPCFQIQKLGRLNWRTRWFRLCKSSNVTITRTVSVQHSPWSLVYFSAWHFSAYRQLISLLQWWTSVWTCPPIRGGLLWRTSMTLISWEKLHLKWSSKYEKAAQRSCFRWYSCNFYKIYGSHFCLPKPNV